MRKRSSDERNECEESNVRSSGSGSGSNCQKYRLKLAAIQIVQIVLVAKNLLELIKNVHMYNLT